LEKEQKSRSTRMVRDYLDRALLDIATLYRDVLMVQSGRLGALINPDLVSEIRVLANVTRSATIVIKLEAILEARVMLDNNASPLLTVESLLLKIK